jgi:ubiquitin carboxyl-terminal hydrolase 7
MVFVKHFDIAHQTLAGIGHFYVHRHMRVADLAMMINERKGFAPNTPLKIYEVSTIFYLVQSCHRADS